MELISPSVLMIIPAWMCNLKLGRSGTKSIMNRKKLKGMLKELKSKFKRFCKKSNLKALKHKNCNLDLMGFCQKMPESLKN